MRDIVIDTNVLIAGILKDSTTRRLLDSKNINFYIPEFAFEEIIKHKLELLNKSELSENEFDELLNLIIENINVIPFEEIKPYIGKAKEIMKNIDLKDAPFIACALYLKSGILSFDEDFKKQDSVRLFDINDLIEQYI